MSKLIGDDGRGWTNWLQAYWSGFETDPAVYRDTWLDLIQRVEDVMTDIGLTPRRDGLVWGFGTKIRSAKWRPAQEKKLLGWFTESEKNLTSATAVWNVDERSKITLQGPADDPIPMGDPGTISMTVKVAPAEDGSFAVVEFYTDHLTESEESHIAVAMSAWLAPVGRQLTAVWGAVFSDPHEATVGTPYENWYFTPPGGGPQLPWRGRRGAREYTRGYYWSNLLGPNHIEQLGGFQKLAENGAAHGLTVEPADLGKEAGAILRIPAPITDFTDDQLRAVRDILAPIQLPAIEPPDTPGRRRSRTIEP